MGNRTELASKGDVETIIARTIWLSEAARQLSSEIDLYPGPAFSFYQDRWSSDDLVKIMSIHVRGMHIELITVAWQQRPFFCSIPDDQSLIRAWCGHPSAEDWIYHEDILFSSKDGKKRRAWVYHDGRWWQIGLCRTLLEQVARRIRRQKAAHGRHAISDKSRKDPALSKHHLALQVQCTQILDALQCLPVPSPSPFPIPSPLSSSFQEEERARENEPTSVERVWNFFIEARNKACEVLGKNPNKISLTARREDHLRHLIDTYGEKTLKKAFESILRSDWHMGRGRHSKSGSRLSWESLTSTGKVNQIEILAELAESPKATDNPKPFAPKPNPKAEDDDGSPIE